MSDLQITGVTDPGRVREQNEDNIAMAPEAGLVVVADGMGGHRAGEVASRLAVDTIRQHIIQVLADADAGDNIEVQAVREAILLANREIYEHAHANPDYAGMGSPCSTVTNSASGTWATHACTASATRSWNRSPKITRWCRN